MTTENITTTARTWMLCRTCVVPLLIWTFLVAISLFNSLQKTNDSVQTLAKTQGREVFRLVEAMRLWNAEHGGIYVMQTERDPPNPYLSAEMRATVTITGKPLTLLNPAYMTRQISGVIEREAGIRLHLTSLHLLNPANQADAWESQALRAFERHELNEVVSLDANNPSQIARYIAPLYVKPDCLACHEKQGYKLGDVRGGLSVQWSATPLLTTMQSARQHSILRHIAVWLLISLLMTLAIRKLLANLAVVKNSELALRRNNENLEATVLERTTQLQDTLHTLRVVGDMAPGVLYQYRLHPDGRTCIPYASERFWELFGVHPVEVRDNDAVAMACIHPDDVPDMISSTKISARDLSQWHHEFRVCRPNGSIRWVLGDTQPMREADGGVLWNGYLRDITEQKMQVVALANSEEQMRLLFKSILHGVVYQNASGEITDANPMAERLLGLSLSQMQGRSSLDPHWASVHEDGTPFPGDQHPAMQALRTGHSICDVVMGVFNPQLDQTRWLLISAIPQFRLGEAHPYEVISTFNDITERKQAEQELRRHKIIVDTAQDGFWMTDAQGNIQEVNQAYADLMGYQIEELIKMHVSDLEAVEEMSAVREHLEKTIAQGHDVFETRHRHKSGELIDIEVSVTFMCESQQFFVFCRDIRERKHIEQSLRDLAYYDALTGLPNRRMLSDRLSMAMASSQRNGDMGALMFLDLDNFKSLNDTHGHEVGDLLLQEVAQRLKRLVRGVDTVARIGGDEFVVLLNSLEQDQVAATLQVQGVAKKILTTLGATYCLALRTTENVVEHHCTASIGVVLFCGYQHGHDDLLQWADNAMYQAKQAGRNRVVFYEHNKKLAQEEQR